MIEAAVFITIAAGVLAWGCAEALRSRILWMAAALLTLMHSLLAFEVFYGWSHETARLDTMRQTAALTGLNVPGGIYINYAFLAVWLADAVWWMRSPVTRVLRPPAVSWAVRSFIFFIIVNGAVVFADGWARVVGLTAVAIAVGGAWRRRARRR